LLKFKTKNFFFTQKVHQNYNFNWIVLSIALIIFDFVAILQFSLVGMFLDSIFTLLFGIGKYIAAFFIFINAFLKILGITYKCKPKLYLFYVFLALSFLFLFSNIANGVNYFNHIKGFVFWRGDYFVFGLKNFYHLWITNSVFLTKNNYYLSFLACFQYGGGIIGAFFCFIFFELTIITSFILSSFLIVFNCFCFFKLHFQIALKKTKAEIKTPSFQSEIRKLEPKKLSFKQSEFKNDLKRLAQISSQNSNNFNSAPKKVNKQPKTILPRKDYLNLVLTNSKRNQILKSSKVSPMGNINEAKTKLNRKQFNLVCQKIKNFEKLYVKAKLYAFENKNIDFNFISVKLNIDYNIAKIIFYFLIQEQIIKTTKQNDF